MAFSFLSRPRKAAVYWAMRRGRRLTLLCLGAVTACTPLWQSGQPWVEPGPVAVQRLPGWATERAAGLDQALQAQCTRRPTLPAPWPGLCAELRLLNLPAGAAGDAALRAWIETRFAAWPLVSPLGYAAGKLTGYHEPVITGSLVREQASQTPLYRPPPGLVPNESWLTRAQIEQATPPELAGRELVWLDSAIDAFFLQVQGSGRVRLRDGRHLRVGFAGHNGHPYSAIGAELIRRGEIAREAMSADAIKTWLAGHPDQASALMQTNPRYVFFAARPGLRAEQGPLGSLAVPLTPHRSLATDPRFVPVGAMLYVQAARPDPAQIADPARASDPAPPPHALVGLAMNQDTGAAIVGEVRADLFTGWDDAAAREASGLNARMRLWVLWPKEQRLPESVPAARRLAGLYIG
ncbi:MAG: MltA domain-containing protein [Burkholderiaceae bacterium]